jgi:hypothetical protein
VFGIREKDALVLKTFCRKILRKSKKIVLFYCHECQKSKKIVLFTFMCVKKEKKLVTIFPVLEV